MRGVDLSLSAAGASVARGFVREAAAAGTVCIDKSSAFRMEPDVPLVVPEVNLDALAGSPMIVAVPNCTTIVAMMALAPLHRAAGLRSLVLSSYQAVSGAGRDGTRELAEQVAKLHDRVEELGHPEPDALPTGDVFGKTMAFNVLPRIDRFAEDGSTGEEVKTVQESRKILGLPDLDVAATCVRVPVPVGHSVSLLARFGRPFGPDEARTCSRTPPVSRSWTTPRATSTRHRWMRPDGTRFSWVGSGRRRITTTRCSYSRAETTSGRARR